MTREILFRGYYPGEHKWVYGSYIQCGEAIELLEKNPAFIIKQKDGRRFEYWMVDKFTVGQYSGFDDHDGNKLFNGDVCYVYGHEEIRGTVKYSSLFGKWLFKFEDKKFKNQTVLEGTKIELYNSHLCLVKVGTIHDEKIKEKWGDEE